MTKVYETFSMDFTSRIEHAQRADGIWFERSQYRDPRYGYKWTAWRKSYSFDPGTRRGEERRVRLPKGD